MADQHDAAPRLAGLALQDRCREPLALAGFSWMRFSMSRDPLLGEILRRIHQDEARHVAFGVGALKEVYRQLGEAERREREDFALEAAALLASRLGLDDVFRRLQLGPRWFEWARTSAGLGITCFDIRSSSCALARKRSHRTQAAFQE